MTIHKSPPILWAWLVCFGCAAVLLLFCSGTSPLYNGHDWTDANTYLTMGRGLLHGVVPYRDLFDHKGPLLYFVYALGALLSPSGFFGIYLLQAAALGTAVLAASAAGLHPEPAAAVRAMTRPAETVYHPDRDRAAAYDRLYREYRTLAEYFARENPVMHHLKSW